VIIYGTRGVTSTQASGTFHCPQCGSGSPYRHKTVRRFFTLYFIPLIPLDRLGEYVECGACGGTYKPAVLELDPEADRAAFEAEFHGAVRGVMLKMMLADGVIEDEELESVATVYEQLAGKVLSVEQIRAEAEALQGDASQSVQDYVKDVRGSLNDQGKELVVRAALAVASADGKVSDTERLLLVEIGEALELTEAHLMGILKTAADA
jgi:tellurite resistance protein